MATPTVKKSWSRIETWLGTHAPSYAKALGKPATEKSIATLTDKFDLKFPKPFVDSSLIHTGQKDECDFIPDGFGTFFLLQLKDIPREWKMLNDIKAYGDFDDFNPEPDDGVANEWWTKAWIPFASNGGGDLLCLDSKPPKGGKKWQVVKFVHDGPERPILASSFGEWLGQVADAVESGELSDLIET